MSPLTPLGSGKILAKLEWVPQRFGEYDSVMQPSLLSLSAGPLLSWRHAWRYAYYSAIYQGVASMRASLSRTLSTRLLL
jgi:hypothetical protein